MALLAALTCVIAERHGVAFFGATSTCHSKHCKVECCPRRLIGHGVTGMHNSSFIISIAVTICALYSVRDSPIWCFRWQPIQLHYVHTLHKSKSARRSGSYRASIRSHLILQHPSVKNKLHRNAAVESMNGSGSTASVYMDWLAAAIAGTGRERDACLELSVVTACYRMPLKSRIHHHQQAWWHDQFQPLLVHVMNGLSTTPCTYCLHLCLHWWALHCSLRNCQLDEGWCHSLSHPTGYSVYGRLLLLQWRPTVELDLKRRLSS